jgi:hypothetical protein
MWGWIVAGAIGLVGLTWLVVLSRKHGRVKAENESLKVALKARERADHAQEDFNASGGIGGAAERVLRDGGR